MKKKLLYEFFIAILAIIAVSISILDIMGHININQNIKLHYIDISILIIFAIDYVIRFILANDKIKFIKQNFFDLIAIIPVNSVFRAFRLIRLFRLLRLLRIIALFNKFTKNSERFLKTNNFIYTLYLCIGTIGLGAVAIYYIERGKTINSFGDALWWSFVTTTTVGYGDISPSTGLRTSYCYYPNVSGNRVYWYANRHNSNVFYK